MFCVFAQEGLITEMNRRIFSTIISAAIALSAAAPVMPVFAEEINPFTVTGGTDGTDYAFESGVLTVKTANNLSIAAAEKVTDASIAIEDGIAANLDFNNIQIELSSGNAVAVPANASLNLTVNGSNTIKGADKGISASNGSSVIIAGSAGSLNAEGTAAGIGGEGSTITFDGGNVVVYGGIEASAVNVLNDANVYAFAKDNKPAVSENAALNAAFANFIITNMTFSEENSPYIKLGGKDIILPYGCNSVFAGGFSAAEELDAKLNLQGQNDGTYTNMLIAEDNSKATVTAASGEAKAERVKLAPAADYTKEVTPQAEVNYEYDRLTNLTAGEKYILKAGDTAAEYTADGNGEISFGSLPKYYGSDIYLIKCGNGTATINSDAQTVSVSRPQLTAMTLKTNPAKVSYGLGDRADWSGMVIDATFGDETRQYSKDIPFEYFGGCGITVTPANGTEFTAMGDVTVKAEYNELSVEFTVNVGKKAQDAITVTGVPETVTYGDAAFSLTVTGGNTSNEPTYTVTGESVSVDGAGRVTVLKAGESTITVTKPRDDIYNDTKAIIRINVEKKTPELVKAPTAKDITRNNRLLESDLTGGVVRGVDGNSLAGTWMWVNKDNYMRDTGDYQEDAVFTPRDTNYTQVTARNITVTVKRNTTGSSGGSGSSGGLSFKNYAAFFNSNGGSNVATVYALQNSPFVEPAAPTRAGFEFAGWYTDQGLTKKYDFSTKALGNVTLYAKWLSQDASQLILTIGQKNASVFGEAKENDVAPVIRNDRTMLPARFVAENLGAAVVWDEDNKAVRISGRDAVNQAIEIVINIGEDTALVNGQKIQLDSPAFIENDRTYTPVRFICENLGAVVDWNADEQKVIIYKAN